MKPIIHSLVLCFVVAGGSLSQALSPTNERNINILTSGGPISILDVAKDLYRKKETDTEVLDVLAELLLQNQNRQSKHYIDAMSWVSRALGRSGNARYKHVLERVANESEHKKVKKQAKKALKKLKDSSEVAQYKKGDISLIKLRNSI